MAVAQGALPPRHVAIHSLAQWDSGMPAAWCVPYLILPPARDLVLGGCRFKGAPVDGRVEIGYGVAASQRGRGVASAAVARMLEIAAASRLVREVVAHIRPDNVASSRVVERLRFLRIGPVVDADGEAVVRWCRPLAA